MEFLIRWIFRKPSIDNYLHDADSINPNVNAVFSQVEQETEQTAVCISEDSSQATEDTSAKLSSDSSGDLFQEYAAKKDTLALINNTFNHAPPQAYEAPTQLTSGSPDDLTLGVVHVTESCAQKCGVKGPPAHESENSGESLSEDEDEPSQLYNLAQSILEECKDAAPLSNLNTAIYLFNEVVDQRPIPHPLRSDSLKDLATALVTRFSLTHQHRDIDRAILLCAEVVREWYNSVNQISDVGGQSQLHMNTSAESGVAGLDSSEVSEINELARITFTDFNQSAQLSSLDTAVTLYRDALLLRPSPHPSRLASLHGLSSALHARFHRTDHLTDLHEAISLIRQAIDVCSESEASRSHLQLDLCAMLVINFERTSQASNLLEAVTRHRDTFDPSHINHEEASQVLDLATHLTMQFEQLGEMTDLQTAISLFREGLALLPIHHPNRLAGSTNLSNALINRFRRLAQREDLDEAISLDNDVLELLPAHSPNRPGLLLNFSAKLATRFESSGHQEDLDRAVLSSRDALNQLPILHPDRSYALNNLGTTLRKQFTHSGQREDLDEIILVHRAALDLRPHPHPLRHTSITNLSDALSARYELLNQHHDLEEAILLCREGLELLPTSHLGRSALLNNLACALKMRFTQSGQQKDLEEAISLHRDSLKLRPPPHPERLSSLNNLAIALYARFEKSGQRQDLDEATSLYQEQLGFLPDTHHIRYPDTLNNLAGALMSQFEQSGQREHLDAAINMSQQSIDALHSIHPLICTHSGNLALALMSGYTHTHESQYLDRAMDAYRVASTCISAPAWLRFSAAKTWAFHADSKHESALEAYRIAIGLLPRLSMLELDFQSRQQALSFRGAYGLASEAAACAIRSGQYSEAVELLEGGRAVFWSQALQLRTPMDDLRDVAPELEKKLRRISQELEHSSLRDVSRHPFDTSQNVMSIEQESSRLYRLNTEWLATLEEVRQLDNFQDFLRPSRLSTLQSAAAIGPVVFLNVSLSRTDAVIMRTSSVMHVPLPSLNYAKVDLLVKLMKTAIASEGGRSFLPAEEVEGLFRQLSISPHVMQFLRLSDEARHAGRTSNTRTQPEDVFCLVLAVLWVSVAEPVIRALNLKKSETPPLLRWCPAGLFAFLPIHAAGLYGIDVIESVSDYVISSYVPTISVVLSTPPLSASSLQLKMMAVIQPKTLPCTIQELQKIETHIPNESLVRFGIPGAPASVDNVVSHLPTMSIAHFACHGQHNTQKPLESALILEDGPLKVSRIMQQSMPNASLAFLCACETAVGHDNLPDEVIHLGATLLFAGFRGVVATIWSIADEDGPKIVDAFYGYLFKEKHRTSTATSPPDIVESARALHIAVAKLRSENAPFIRWVPFVHLGR